MNDKAIRELETLKKAMDNDPRIVRLNELESVLSGDKEVQSFSLILKEKEENYSSLLSLYGEKDQKTIEARRSLYEAKKALDSLPSVMNYNEAFIAVRDLYMQIDDIVFSSYRRKTLRID